MIATSLTLEGAINANKKVESLVLCIINIQTSKLVGIPTFLFDETYEEEKEILLMPNANKDNVSSTGESIICCLTSGRKICIRNFYISSKEMI